MAHQARADSANALDSGPPGDARPNRAANDRGPTGSNLTFPPYPMPLLAIQVKIRTFEPDSKLVGKVTIEQSFLPQ